MKILYGVQATGNGHITRARAMAAAFAKTDIQVDFLFSGRPQDELFDMQPFGDFQVRRGITFATAAGRVLWSKTILKNNLFQLFRDSDQLLVDDYDLVITDYEPITARAGRRAGIKVLGLGHQYAFTHRNVPLLCPSPLHRWVMNNLAPADVALGLHWHHFDEPLLPPVAPVSTPPLESEKDLCLVYLPFESLEQIQQLLAPFNDKQFLIYHPQASDCEMGQFSFRSPSRKGFQQDLARAGAVICNAGFELPSEALQLGKKLLVKPVLKQMEQLSNAQALEQLGLAKTMPELDTTIVAQWLQEQASSRVVYPDVAGQIVDWIADWILTGMQTPVAELAGRLWAASSITRGYPLKRAEIKSQPEYQSL
jgi:uncharacterized protein (TIGR00661 family)